MLQVVPQASVLGPLHFDTYLNDLLFLDWSCNLADDNTFYVCNKDLEYLINRLEHDNFLAIEWLQINYMKLNEDKCHLLVEGYKHESMAVKIGDARVW